MELAEPSHHGLWVLFGHPLHLAKGTDLTTLFDSFLFYFYFYVYIFYICSLRFFLLLLFIVGHMFYNVTGVDVAH
jgi:hypothetical protein